MPRKISNGSTLAETLLLLNKLAPSLSPTARLVYVGLLAHTRPPYVDRSPFLVSNLSTLTGLSAATITDALKELRANELFDIAAGSFTSSYYLPQAMATYTELNKRNPNHIRSLHKRLESLPRDAEDLIERFRSDYPEWSYHEPTTGDHDGLEPTAGSGATGD